MEKLDQEHQYLWDGSEPGWCLIRVEYTEVFLSVDWPGPEPTPADIETLRRALEGLEPIVKRVTLEQLELGPYSSAEAQTVIERCQTAGLEVEQRCVHRDRYIPFNRETQTALAIEDEEKAAEIVRLMQEHGVDICQVGES